MYEIRKILQENADKAYKLFSEKLVPDTSYKLLGVRVPVLKKIAKDYSIDTDFCLKFMSETHSYFEEYFLHGLLINELKFNIQDTLSMVESFLTYIDNWSICDCVAASLKIFKKNLPIVYDKILIWIKSKKNYTVRFGVVCLIAYFLIDDYADKVIDLVKRIKSNDYYINMALAWLISVLIVKYYDKTLPLLLNKELLPFVHNKAIQKARESFRVSEERKIFLKSLKI